MNEPENILTPRTDLAENDPAVEYFDNPVVISDFARTLERELATVTAERDLANERVEVKQAAYSQCAEQLAIVAAERDAHKRTAMELELKLEEVEKDRNGNWLDKYGCCKVCDGEIPHGHASNCDIYKLEQEIRTLATDRDHHKALYDDARKDTERLDAVIENAWSITWNPYSSWEISDCYEHVFGTGDTSRAAIEAAITRKGAK